MSQVVVQWITPTTLHCDFIDLSSEINKAILIGECRQKLYAQLGDKFTDIVPGFNELLVQFIPKSIDYYPDQHTVKQVIQVCINQCYDDIRSVKPATANTNINKNAGSASAVSTTLIPVDFSANLDLSNVADCLGLSAEEVIAQFCDIEFNVILNGFMPGFVYLSGLPKHFHLPRLASPRLQVPAGAVAIADAYCGIYPQRSPGGWHILGVTEHGLFDINRPTPATFATGDRIQFYSQPSTDLSFSNQGKS